MALMKDVSIFFENYKKENDLFRKRIQDHIEMVFRLESESDHKKFIEGFECDFASYNGSKFAIAVNSGTTALELALKASDINEGDEVILPAYTYISTALAVSNIGAIPVFVDIEEDTLTIDPKRIKESITKNTRAIIPVHIHGNPCKMDEILDIAEKSNSIVIEDCSHAHGAEYKNKKVGNFGLGCYSCHSSKFFSGIGNSGIITINNENIYEKIICMINVKNDPDIMLSRRTPCLIDAIQAAMLKAKLPLLDTIIDQKRKIAARYISELPKAISTQNNEKDVKHVYRDFIIQHDDRASLKCFLEKKRIATKIRYDIPLHITKYFKHFFCKKGHLAVTEKICHKLLCLPISFVLTKEAVLRICSVIREHEND